MPFPIPSLQWGGGVTPQITRQGTVEASTRGGADASLLAQQLNRRLASAEPLRMAERVYLAINLRNLLVGTVLPTLHGQVLCKKWHLCRVFWEVCKRKNCTPPPTPPGVATTIAGLLKVAWGGMTWVPSA